MFQNDSLIQSSHKIDTGLYTKPVSKKIVFASPKFIAKTKIDSIFIKDSLQRADSLTKANSKKLFTTKQVKGNIGKSLPSFPHTENWVFISLILLLLLMWISLQKSAGILLTSVKTAFKPRESSFSYKISSVNSLEYKIYLTLFIISIISLFAYELFYSTTDGFNLTTYFQVFGATVVFYVFKILTIEFIGKVFFNVRQIKEFKNTYFNFMGVFSLVLFPLLVLMTYHPSNWAIPFNFILLFLIIIFYILLLIKVFQIFFTKLLDVFYIFLYLCTLEILPLLLLFRVYYLIM